MGHVGRDYSYCGYYYCCDGIHKNSITNQSSRQLKLRLIGTLSFFGALKEIKNE